MGNLESLGDAVTGGILGRAVEPKTGKTEGHSEESNCLNCGAPLAGPYCAQCGQRAHIHQTMGAFAHDLLHGVLHFEGKVWKTLPLLAWRPGELTRRYIDGQRASFVSPIALFLFCVFLLFAVGGLTGGLALGSAHPEAAKQDLSRELQKNREQLAKLDKERAEALKAGRPTEKLDERLHDLRAETATLSVLNGEKVESPIEINSNGMPGWLRRTVKEARDNPDLVLFKLKTSAYKYSWMLIPLSVPFVWLLFPFSRRFRLYDHTIFVTYSLCFMSLLAIAGMVLGWIGAASIASLLFFIPPFHMYRQLKGAYGLTRAGALWRATLLTIFAFISAGLFAVVVAGIGFAA